MFSAFKRFASKGDAPTGSNHPGNGPTSHQTMSSSLQRKFARGVQYNMKIIIKGDRNVGKSCLFYRLQGKKFVEEYIPTEEIQVTSIQWSYKATDDVVKVEVWDVVDKGKKKRRFDGLKLENGQLDLPEETALDAEFLDVYKGTNGVIMVLDITKSWTFEYVQREMSKVPSHIPVIILANHCDMSHHRTITPDHITYYIESLEGQRTAQVRYSESSMRNAFGLKLLHKFFNLPFLQLQRETLVKQLERNEVEINSTVDELNMYAKSEDADYEKFLEKLTQKRREVADNNANIPTTNNLTLPKSVSQQFNNQSGNTALGNPANSSTSSQVRRSQSASIIIGAGKPIPFGNTALTSTKSINNSTKSINNSTKSINNSKSTNNSGANSTNNSSSNTTSSGANNNTTSSSLSRSQFTGQEDGMLPDLRRLDVSAITSVEEFCPDDVDGENDKSWMLDDMNSVAMGGQDGVDGGGGGGVSDDSDGDTGNPLVSELQDDLDVDDVKLAPYCPRNLGNTVPPGGGGSSEVELDVKNTPDELDSTINSEISEITSDAFDTWIGQDSKWRRSPEGGEDVSAVNQIMDCSNSTVYDDSTSVTSSNLHAELLGSKTSPYDSEGDDKIQSKKVAKKDTNRRDKEKDKDKEKEKDKSERKLKHKKSSKHRVKDKEEQSTSDRRHRSKRDTTTTTSSSSLAVERNRDELEEFLNGSSSHPAPTNAAYEAL